MGRLQIQKNVPGAVEPQIGIYYQRPYAVVNADEMVTSIRSRIRDSDILSYPQVGSVDQFSDSPDFLCNSDLTSRFERLFHR